MDLDKIAEQKLKQIDNLYKNGDSDKEDNIYTRNEVKPSEGKYAQSYPKL